MSLLIVEQIILWGLVFIIATVVIFYFLIYYQLVSLPDTVVNALASRYSSPCELEFPLVYRESVYLPAKNGVYEKKLATALLDTCFMTSSANCTAILPIDNPPGFTDQMQLNGIEPVSQQNLFIGYLFWNKNTRQAILSYSGTENAVAWRADFRYHQVAPLALNNYKDGMLVHEGFYEIYLAVKDKIWSWFNDNPWVEDLFITGHSLGAALSCISAFDFAGKTKNLIHYSFASPRLCNVEFAKEFDRLIPTSMNVINIDDVIPALVLSQLFDYTYESLNQIVPFTKSGGSLSYNHIDAYYYNLPDKPECSK